MKLKFQLFIATVFLSVGCPDASAAMEDQTPLNFVFILVDDLGKKDMSIEGSQFHETPNIDSIGRRALRFERGYSACQVCSPSRAAIQTGKTPARLGITDYISLNGGNQPQKWRRNTKLLPASYASELPLKELTIAEALKQNGYTTFFAGKWHLGGDGFTPSEQGYDVNVGGYHFGTPPGGYHSPYRNPKLSDDAPGAELPIRLGKETAAFIESSAKENQPFFAMLSFYSVHGPIQCSESRFKKYQAKAETLGLVARTDPRFLLDRTQEVRQVQDHPIYAGMMEAMDDSVGFVLKAIEKSGVAENTVVIFTSDNGGVSSGDGYATSCLPMRGGKGRQWEGGIRQPYYISWPGVTIGGTTQVLATGMDFYPTILEMAGIAPNDNQKIDGISLVPVLKGKKIPERPLFWHYPHYGNQGGEPSAMMMAGDMKLIYYLEDGRSELYDVAKDIGEQNNLAESYPAKVASMLNAIKEWQGNVGARNPALNPNYDPQNYARSMQQKQQRGMPNREKQHAAFLNSDYKPKGGWWDQRKSPKIVD